MSAVFEQLLEQNRHFLWNVAMRATGNKEDAEDLMQLASIRAFQAFPRFRGDATFTTWFIGIMRNLTINMVRDRRKCPVISLDDPVHPIILHEDVDFISSWMSEHRRSLLSPVLAKLNHSHREVLVLRFLQEYSVDEVAQILHVSPGTIKSRTNRALEAARVRFRHLGAE